MAKKCKAQDAVKHSERHAKSLDPALAALFEQSLGPVSISKPALSASPQKLKVAEEPSEDSSSEGGSASGDETLSSGESGDSEPPPRKRRRVDRSANLEANYLDRLAQQDRKDQQARHRRTTENVEDDSSGASDAESEILGYGNSHAGTNGRNDPPAHKILVGDIDDESDIQVKRTVFLGNVSTDAIKSKSSRKELLKHLSNTASDQHDQDNDQGIDSLRFRSTAFATGVGSKRAAYAKKELMDQTTRSSNAYVVYKSEAAARKAAPQLNGTIVLDRHLRADYLGDPAKVDHRRCVFVGNLSFVDEETDNDQRPAADGTQSRPRAKEPADAEEGLWRAFGKVGKIESVRVVRDKNTRVGKGIAYVQFADENAVEAALLMNEKKYPPMLPRKLRVMRAKRNNKKSGVGAMIVPRRSGPRAYKRVLRAAQATATNESIGKGGSGSKSLVFEGARAQPTKRQAREKKKQERKAKRRYASKPNNRGSRRAAAFRAGGAETK